MPTIACDRLSSCMGNIVCFLFFSETCDCICNIKRITYKYVYSITVHIMNYDFMGSWCKIAGLRSKNNL